MTNFTNFNRNNYISQNIIDVLNTNRVPHALLLQSDNLDIIQNNIEYLTSWAVCRELNSPCFSCAQCNKVLDESHIDIYYAKKQGKKQIVNVEEIRYICKDSYIRPNESNYKVYVIQDCDKMQREAQNAILKILEEPPQSILYILTCKNYEDILSTVRSRVTHINLDNIKHNEDFQSEVSFSIAVQILEALCENTEYNLLVASRKLSESEYTIKTIEYLEQIITDALTSSYSNVYKYEDISRKLLKTVKRQGLINIIQELNIAKEMLKSNINMTLFITWISSTLTKQKYI